MGFEVFEKNSAPIPTVPSVTIQKRGLISMNRSAYALIDSPEAVELLWDADRRVIGIRPTSPENPNAYPARVQSVKTGRGPVIIAGNLFTRYIELDTTEARRWVPEIESGILTIDLKSAGQRVTGNRSRGPSAEDAEAAN